jgi:beta-lactamase regulating signal transducer with metallopeptidase domain
MSPLNLLTWSDGLLAWLLTYALHSTLLLGGAFFLSRRLPLAVRETVWKSALVGGLLTASLHLAVGGPQLPGLTPEPAPVLQAAAPAALWTPSFIPQAEGSVAGGNLEATSGEAVKAALPWSSVLALIYLLGALGSLALLITSYRRLHRRLRDRRFVYGPVLEALESLLARCGWPRSPLLTASRNLAVPIAQGVLRPEICLPRRALALAADEQESLLAHELAHVVRKDPAWLVLSRTLEALFFFQPLNRLARRRLQEIAEFRCDEWAARWTGKPESLARCLTEVAGWQLRQGQLPVAAMAQGTEGLRQRISRLLEPATASARKPWWLQPALGLGLLAFALAAPGFAPAAQADDPAATPPAPEAPAAPAAPQAPKAPKAPSAPEAPTPPTAPAAPDLVIPPVEVPEIRVPEIRVPEIHIPEIHIPSLNLTIPAVSIPAVSIPEIEMPEIRIPEIRIPATVIDGEALRGPSQEELRAMEQAHEELTRQLVPRLEQLQETLRLEIEPRMELLTEEIERARAAGQEIDAEALEKALEGLHQTLEQHQGRLESELHRELQEGVAQQRAALEQLHEHQRQEVQMRIQEQARAAQEEVRQAQAAARQELRQEVQRQRAEVARQSREMERAARETHQERARLDRDRAEQDRARAERQRTARERAEAREEPEPDPNPAANPDPDPQPDPQPTPSP